MTLCFDKNFITAVRLKHVKTYMNRQTFCRKSYVENLLDGLLNVVILNTKCIAAGQHMGLRKLNMKHSVL